ncbi:MAG: hypothetical protein E2O39_06905 [Planctomycetota bacterium]|nr:MAG: hypothetical protein E2O39_06905 [Planctomycetota bacterium]
MSIFSGTFAFLRGVLTTDEPDATIAVAPEPAPQPAPESAAEFGDLLESLDAVLPAVDDTSILALKDATITELQKMLAQLRPVGDRLAETERYRLAAVARIGELEVERDCAQKAFYQVRVENARLRSEAEKQERMIEAKASAIARANDRLIKLREKLEERKRTAAQRWREIMELRAGKKALVRVLAEKRASRHSDPSGPDDS